MGAALTNKVCNCFVVDEKLVRRNQPSGDARHQTLRENTRQGGCKLYADLILLSFRERVDNAVDGLRCVIGMKR